MRRASIFRWLGLAALVALLTLTAACGGGEEAATPPEPAQPPPAEPAPPPAEEPAPPAEPGLGSAFDVASAGDVTLQLWWLGDLEAPGIEAWMDETVAAFEAQYPNVNIETTLYETGKWIQTQQTACQSQSGPDLWYNWSGTWSLEPAWKGCTVPNEEILSSEDIAANPHTQETLYEGQTWDFPLYQFVYPIVYNKALFEAAGLDPESPPATWDDFVAAMEALKASGVTPFALGLKDGFGAEILAAGQLEKQPASDPNYYKQLVIDGDFTGADWTGWLQKAVEMKAYFNEDANSLGFAEGLALFQNEQAAMVAGAPGVQAVIKAMTDEGKQVGIMKAPPFDDGSWADSLVHTGNGFQVTSWSENKEVAGAFMAFMQTPERLTALYEATGNFPTSTNWDPAQVTSPTDQQMLQWLGEKGDAFWAANYTPVDLDVNATFVAFQKLMAGEFTTAEEMAQLYQDVIETWREANPQVVENFTSWLG
jgi:raffinose/stachyose/melibiose transport system substrate-binding protein